MREALNRLCTEADRRDENILVLLDEINESERAKRLPNMYGHILSRATEREEMLRIIEPPMHVDSVLSSNIQFADWVAAAVSRAIDYQLIRNTKYTWVPHEMRYLHGKFTYESKLRLWHRAIDDVNHSQIVHQERPVHPRIVGHSVAPEQHRKLVRAHEAAIRARNPSDSSVD